MLDKKSLSVRELDAQTAFELPQRELMALVRFSNFNDLVEAYNILNYNNIRVISVDNNNLTLNVNVSCVAVNAVLVNKPHTCAK
jgi:hypothetical protein